VHAAPAPLTIFAPKNAAVELQQINLNSSESVISLWRRILKCHVVYGRWPQVLRSLAAVSLGRK
jgi:uncharacterized surface protein with fasciclin (FAS1) repeats